MTTRSKEVNIYMNPLVLTQKNLEWSTNVWRTAATLQLTICGGEVICCVPSEGICLCLVPSQDSRRERSNNFQAFVKMALETLLGSCRRKHGGPRGRQGWEGPRFPPWTCTLDCCTAGFHHSVQSPLTEADCEPDLYPSPSVVQPLPPWPICSRLHPPTLSTSAY